MRIDQLLTRVVTFLVAGMFGPIATGQEAADTEWQRGFF